MAWVVKNKKTGLYRDVRGYNTVSIEWSSIYTDEEKENEEILFNPETHKLVEIEIQEKGE